MTNDTAVYDAVRLNVDTGQREWIDRMGRRDAIARDGLEIDLASLAYCPHEWIGSDGYVDVNLAKQHPYHLAL
ncbi:hypothetical protein AYJ54_43520 [Bradyrhizobium centrolobii]|uniref:Uncharacterized protein n=1 Tax=Bradyrhizobium centrolobii TaxID=1505087 RepID=A0A176Z1T5_9BRAD|nr:hypothetical protein [Bradyrhizobium centrolobii]OAF13677.1 hypothetical protein AYJ54_43520 [Bradyrhizobium centrolobii]